MADTVLKLAQNPPQDPVERRKLFDAARELMYKTEDVHVLTHRIYFSGMQLYLADIAAELEIFTTFIKSPEKLWTVKELATQLKRDELLLARILRGLAAYSMISVDEKGQYGTIPATHTLADPGVAGCVRHNALTTFPAIGALPPFLRQTDHKMPDDVTYGPAQLGHRTDQHMWTWMESHPENLKALLINMAAQRIGQESWITQNKVFPTEYLQLSKDDLAAKRPVFVDVGSGSGHQSISLRQNHPEIEGRVIVQDLGYTIAALDTALLSKLQIEPMEHDFFTAQKVDGAKAYYLRNIFHDFLDERSTEILKNLRAAAKPDSVVIIDDIVVSEPEAQWQQVNYDILMMSCMAAMERTAPQWEALLKATGFKIKEIRTYDKGSGDSLIIASPI